MARTAPFEDSTIQRAVTIAVLYISTRHTIGTVRHVLLTGVPPSECSSTTIEGRQYSMKGNGMLGMIICRAVLL